MRLMFIWKTEEKIFKQLHIIMALLFIMLAGYVVSLNKENHIIISLLFLVYFGLACFRHFYLSNKKTNFWQLLFPYFEISILFFITTLDVTKSVLSVIILIAWDIAVDYKTSYGIVFSIVSYFVYMSTYISVMDMPIGSIITLFIIAAFQFTLFLSFAFLTRRYSLQSVALRKTTAELHAKMLAMEEMAILKERNRIAVEIHNTVGHQLTTALVQIEATQLILDKDLDEGKRRLGIIKEQVRKGLKELQTAINAINAEGEFENFEETTIRLLEQVKTHTGIHIDFTFDAIDEARIKQKKILYHVILESITNAIKHGQCKKIVLRLKKDKGVITLSAFNDGKVSEDFQYGYGLNRMKDSLKSLGGSLLLNINEDGWFGIIAQLPIFSQGGPLDE